MMKCTCGNELGSLATSCPKCGKTFVFKTALIVLVFILVFGSFMIYMMVKYG
jgi:hypothetical protein